MHQKCTLQPIQGVTLYQEGEDVPQEVSPGLKVLAGASCGEHTVQAGWQFQIDDEQQTVEAVVTVEDPERCVALCSKKGGDLRPLDIHKVGAGSVDMDHTTAPGFALYLAERSWEDQLPAASTATKNTAPQTRARKRHRDSGSATADLIVKRGVLTCGLYQMHPRRIKVTIRSSCKVSLLPFSCLHLQVFLVHPALTLSAFVAHNAPWLQKVRKDLR
jgi:hypothetical protein